MNDRECLNCYWFKKTCPPVGDSLVSNGRCQNKPPSRQGWSLVKSTDWCPKHATHDEAQRAFDVKHKVK